VKKLKVMHFLFYRFPFRFTSCQNCRPQFQSQVKFVIQGQSQLNRLPSRIC
jgi:hypothetical protein